VSENTAAPVMGLEYAHPPGWQVSEAAQSDGRQPFIDREIMDINSVEHLCTQSASSFSLQSRRLSVRPSSNKRARVDFSARGLGKIPATARLAFGSWDEDLSRGRSAGVERK